MLHSRMPSLLCLKGQSRSLQTPFFRKLVHSGMRSGIISCRKPQLSPFMHMPLIQKRHTVCR